MIRAAVDTNVLVSGIISEQGIPRQFLGLLNADTATE